MEKKSKNQALFIVTIIITLIMGIYMVWLNIVYGESLFELLLINQFVFFVLPIVQIIKKAKMNNLDYERLCSNKRIILEGFVLVLMTAFVIWFLYVKDYSILDALYLLLYLIMLGIELIYKISGKKTKENDLHQTLIQVLIGVILIMVIAVSYVHIIIQPMTVQQAHELIDSTYDENTYEYMGHTDVWFSEEGVQIGRETYQYGVYIFVNQIGDTVGVAVDEGKIIEGNYFVR